MDLLCRIYLNNIRMNLGKHLPVFNIANFEDYNQCHHFDNNFYVRVLDEHIKDNTFINTPHGHDFYLVLLVTHGSGIHNIDFNEYKIEPGSMFILSPGQMHYWEMSKDINGYILFFTKEYFLLDFTHDRLTRLPFFKSTFNEPYLKLNEAEVEFVSKSYQKIIYEYSDRKLQYHDMIRLYLNAMLIQLARLYREEQKANFDFVSYELIQLNTFESLVDKYFKSHHPINYYAEEMNISQKQLTHMCKKTVNKTPLEMIMERIVLEAKRMLIHSNMSVSAISQELEYTDNSYFIRLFKKVCGCTPEQFRNDYSTIRMRMIKKMME